MESARIEAHLALQIRLKVRGTREEVGIDLNVISVANEFNLGLDLARSDEPSRGALGHLLDATAGQLVAGHSHAVVAGNPLAKHKVDWVLELRHVHRDVDHHILGAAADGEVQAVARVRGTEVIIGGKLATLPSNVSATNAANMRQKRHTSSTIIFRPRVSRTTLRMPSMFEMAWGWPWTLATRRSAPRVRVPAAAMTVCRLGWVGTLLLYQTRPKAPFALPLGEC